MPSVVVPLYIYPGPGAWEPMLAAAAAHPQLQFVCVVNPNNGPGPAALPDDSYAAALASLCALPNIQPVGYVHCTYGERDWDSIKADIDVYAQWAAASQGRFHVDGIFIDEAPWEPCKSERMAELARHIRRAWGATPPPASAPAPSTGSVPSPAPSSTSSPAPSAALPPAPSPSPPPASKQPKWFARVLSLVTPRSTSASGGTASGSGGNSNSRGTARTVTPAPATEAPTTGIVIYNPGAVVVPAYFAAADHVVVFEQSHQHWFEYFVPHGLAQIPAHLRSKATVMVHSFGAASPGNEGDPAAGDDLSLASFVSGVSKLGFGGVYITDQLGGGYNRWPSDWTHQIECVDRCVPSA